MDKNAAYPKATVDMKKDGELWRRLRLRQMKSLNNIVEQAHRNVKRRLQYLELVSRGRVERWPFPVSGRSSASCTGVDRLFENVEKAHNSSLYRHSVADPTGPRAEPGCRNVSETNAPIHDPIAANTT
jgi:DDE domain